MRRKVFMVALVALSLFVAAGSGTQAQVGQIGPPEEIRQAIETKARQLDLGGAQTRIAEYSLVRGGITGWSQSFERGILYYVPRHGVLLVSHRMNQEAYNRTGGESRTLGFPISNEFRCLTPDPRDRYQRFERGIIFWRAAENRYSIERDLAPPTTMGDCSRRSGPTDPVVGGGIPRHRYRISIIGFTANRQTFDGHQELDGKGDEVYIVAQVAKFQANGEMTSYTYGRSVLMGDTNLRPANEERMTIGNLSDQGGIGNGYTYMPARNPGVRYRSPTLPWVVYEGELAMGFHALIVIPMIWEWDGNDRPLNTYRNGYFGPGRPAFFYGTYGRPPIRNDWVTQLVSDSMRFANGILPTSIWGEGPILTFPGSPLYVMPDGDQPIGLNQGRNLVPKFLFLSEQIAQRVVTTNYPAPAVRTSDGNIGTTVESYQRLGPGVVPIRYNGTDEGTGDYTLFVKVEQIP